MKIRPKTVTVTGGVIAVMILTGLIAFQQKKDRIYLATNENIFEQQYDASIASLHSSVNMVESRFDQGPSTRTPIELQVAQERPGPDRGTPSNPTLQGIAWNLRRPLVMLNNKVYTTGDVINGYQIEKILPDRIIVRNRLGTQKQIKLREDSL